MALTHPKASLMGLPPELRRKLWRYFLPLQETLKMEANIWEGSCIFKYEGYILTDDGRPLREVPSSLLICAESRIEALNYYRVVLPHSGICVYPRCSNSNGICVGKIGAGYVERMAKDPKYFDASRQGIYAQFHTFPRLRLSDHWRSCDYWFSALAVDEISHEGIARKKFGDDVVRQLEKVQYFAIDCVPDGGFRGQPVADFHNQRYPRIVGLLARFQNLKQLWIRIGSAPEGGHASDMELILRYHHSVEINHQFGMGVRREWAAEFMGGVEQPQGTEEHDSEYFNRLKRDLRIPLPVIKMMDAELVKQEMGLLPVGG